MQVIRSVSELPEEKRYALTIGNFDGVHLGHQSLLKNLLKQCEKESRDLAVITFVPHPLTILRNQKSFLLNSYEERRGLLKDVGVKYLIEIDFTRDFSTLTPEQFLDGYVLANEKIEALYLGYDFAFGANKRGNHEFVRNYCKEKCIEVFVQDKFQEKEKTFSSTLVRDCLKNGEAQNVFKYLGRPYFLTGRVIRGAGRGHQIGFPTANIPLELYRIAPQNGVYATKCHFKGCSYISITNVGFNPTFNNEESLNIETNVFDFDGDLYGEEIKVEFIRKIRDEKKFSSVNELIEQITKDVALRRSFHE